VASPGEKGEGSRKIHLFLKDVEKADSIPQTQQLIRRWITLSVKGAIFRRLQGGKRGGVDGRIGGRSIHIKGRCGKGKQLE